MSDRYTNYPCSFNAAGLIFVQIGGASQDFNQSMNEYIPDGTVDRSVAILNSAGPMTRIRTRDLATVFATLSATAGYNCTGSSIFRLQQRAAGGVYAGGTNNVTMAAALGLLYPDSLSASGDQPAELSLTFCGLSATGLSTDPPLVPANSVDFSAAPTPIHVSTFYLGAAYHNSVALVGLQSISVDFGLSVPTYLSDGKVFPTECSIIARRPSFTLTFVKADMIFTQTPTIFATALAGVFAVYFRKGVPGAARLLNATANHCKISCATGSQMPVSIEAAGETDATISWRVIPTSVLSLSIASAIP